MSGEVLFHPRAREDITDQATYLAGEASIALAERFLESVERTTSHLAEMPRMGRPWRGTRRETRRGVRVWRVEGFPKILIFYRAEGSTLRIIRVLHGARDLPPLIETSLQGLPEVTEK